MNLFSILKSLEVNEDIHLARILILLNEFSSIEQKGEIEGLTKLAKLDFLLRYPVYLEKAMREIQRNQVLVHVREHERRSVESRMVRFRYGPWDFRYRKFINILIAKRLVYIRVEGRSYHLGLTKEGNEIAESMILDSNFKDIAERAKLIRRHFNLSGTNLMKFIYKTFPEIGTMQFGIEIN